MDVNAKVWGMSLNECKFHNKNVYMIFEVSFSFWYGDLMRKLND